MEKVNYHVNLNYELFLSGSNKQIKGASWFDHIFFFINKNPKAILKTSYTFTPDYLQYIKLLGVSSNSITSKGPSIPWWGECRNLELEKYFNSKITMTELGIKEDWISVPSTTSPKNIKDELIFPVISREEWGVSGRGIKILRSIDELDTITKKSVYSNFVKKIKDYGVTFNLDEDSYFIIENYIDDYGQFKGGEIKSIENSIGERNFNKLIEIRDKLINLGATNTIQIDTFTYQGGFHPFVEVNYRKTMGLMVSEISNFFDYKYSYWGIVRLKRDFSFIQVIEIFNKFNMKVVLLSPVDRFLSVAFLSDIEMDGFKKIKELEVFLSEF